MYDRTLLLGGCVDGMIVLFDWQNENTPGKISFKIEVRFYEYFQLDRPEKKNTLKKKKKKRRGKS